MILYYLFAERHVLHWPEDFDIPSEASHCVEPQDRTQVPDIYFDGKINNQASEASPHVSH